MMRLDRRGLPVTCDTQSAITALDAATEAFVAHRADCANHLAAALAADGDCVIARCFQGFALKLMAHQDFEAKAASALEAAQAAFDRRGGNPRERAYLAALAAWVRGEMRAAAARLDAHLAIEPHDLLAFKLSHAIHFMGGETAAMRHAALTVLPAWSTDMPGAGFVRGCLAFAFEESGDYPAALLYGRQAVALDPRDAWSVHAVAHVHEMRGEAADGLRWLELSIPALEGCNNFSNHLAWHMALFELELGRIDAAIERYDRVLGSIPGDDYRDLCNAVSLLVRFECLGRPMGQRWQELADLAERQLGDGALAFAAVHRLMALVHAGRWEIARKMINRLNATACRSSGDQAKILGRVALPLGEAILAHGKGEHGRATDLFLGTLRRIGDLGGSRAQGDVFIQIALDANRKAGRGDAAAALLAERARLRRGGSVLTAGVARSSKELGALVQEAV
jgi:tetratricopeptide (TPR) repeat protein